ncbi:putative transcription factor interactor and regulator CCHC(Zn) family [Helianthus annuus]|uniref:Transcription factor interactor and regulator CCHC(Zn) family n=2 Tax=Helianthus annuus TaxID=4232 RepID=A0A9K3EAA1_HELAN|nr:putative transcription factor interactor and regulator CCHC(Zn) family [Helianthus annuus]
MSATLNHVSAAHGSSYDQVNLDQNFQHSGIRATERQDAGMKPTNTVMPCQHCIDEKNERKRRSRRERLCYYCHLPGHQIYTCKSKENDEESQLIRQAINNGIRTQREEVHCREEMIVTGTDGGQWNDIWYVNPTFCHHFVNNLNVFKRVKHIMGVETRSGMNNFLFIRGVGIAEVKMGNETLSVPSVFYSPDINRNVLSLEQLTLQGFTVRRTGDTCKIFPMFSSPVMNTKNEVTGLTKEEELGIKEKERLQNMCGIDDEFKNDYLNSYFETLNVSDETEIDWNLMILKSLEFHEFNDCKAVISMLDDREYVFKYKYELSKKFEEMVKWFLTEYLGITHRPFPPYTKDNHKIDLMDLYTLVDKDGGYREITTENLWPIIAKDMGFEYKDGDFIRIVYAMYLDTLEYYYKFKKVQQRVHDKRMISEEDEVSRGDLKKTNSLGSGRQDAAVDVHKEMEPNQVAFYAGVRDDNWNQMKKRKKFDFNQARWAVEEANRSVIKQAHKHNQV